MGKRRMYAAALFVWLVFLCGTALADVPRLITFQGRLTDDSGKPYPDDLYEIDFYLYTDSLAGDLLFSEIQKVEVKDGLFNVQLGLKSNLADSIFEQYANVFLAMDVAGGAGELAPRIRLTSGAFAYHARIADKALSLGGWTDDGAVVRLSNDADQVGIGTASPGGKLHVTSSGMTAIHAQNSAASGSATGVYGSSSSTSGRGVMGSASAPSGSACGVEGYSASPDGYAFYGFNEAESGEAYAFYGENISPDGIAVFGVATNDDEHSTGIGVYGRSKSDYDGTGVYGEATNTGTTYGVRGVSTHGVGVRGEQSSSGNQGSLGRTDEGVYGRGFGGIGDGVHGVAAGTDPSSYGAGLFGESACPSWACGVLGWWDGDTTTGRGYGGYFSTKSRRLPALVGQNTSQGEGSIGTYGYANTNDGECYGVYGEAVGAEARAVYGNCSGVGGVNYGVYGKTAGPTGFGVYGANTAPSNWYSCAIRGERAGLGVGVEGSGGTRGVYGHVEPSGELQYYGVRGFVNGGTGFNYGVYGSASGGEYNFGGYFEGDVQVTGTLYKGVGAFKIDHPLDPEGKYLCHSFVESPDMKNIYDGVIATDGNGYATITLPEWFEALNRDFRYQLTVLDEGDTEGFIQAKVVRKIANNQFTIRTSSPNTEVSWQVTGIRHDKFAEANPIPVEMVKPVDEYGTYLHAEALGKPIERQLERVREAAANRAMMERQPLPDDSLPTECRFKINR